MSAVLTVPPVLEPWTTAEVKAAPALRIDSDVDDVAVAGQIVSARQETEEHTGRALITQTWRLPLAAWPALDYIELPRSPLISVTSVTYYDTDDTSAVLAAANYTVVTDSEPGRITLDFGESWPATTLRPADAIQIVFVAGYGVNSSDVPQPIRQAIILKIRQLYEGPDKLVEMAIDSLLNNYRVHS